MMNQIRPEILRAAKIYSKPLNGISADVREFEERWGRGRISAIAEGFDDLDQMINFRRRLRPALARAAESSLQQSAKLPPATDRLLVLLKEHGGIGRLLPPHLTASVGALAKAAAELGLSIKDIRGEHVDQIFAELKGNSRRSAKGGLNRINDLLARSDLPQEFNDLLPETTLPLPTRKVAAKSVWSRRAGSADAARLWREFEDFVAQKRGWDALGRPITPEDSNFSAAAEASYEHNLNLALTELVRRGDFRAGTRPSLRDVCSATCIERVMDLWSLRQIEGEVRQGVSTLHTLVCRLAHMAEVGGAKKKEVKRLKKLKKAAKAACGNVGRMNAKHVAWVQEFAANPAMQRALDTLPETLMRKAEAILRDWDKHKTAKRQKLMMQALRMGITACAAAILFRGSPVRAANLRNLTFRGDAANIRLSKAEVLRIVIPGSQVKNGADIDHDGEDDAWPVIAWYLDRIRPKLVADHPYLRRSKTPIVDSDFLFPSTRMDRGLEETAFANHYVEGCKLAGLDLVLHLARHVTVYLTLDADPNAWVQAAAMLEDNVDTVRKHYAWMDKRKASRAGREILNASRKERHKTKKGDYDVAA
jgi:hypothetical protein